MHISKYCTQCRGLSGYRKCNQPQTRRLSMALGSSPAAGCTQHKSTMKCGHLVVLKRTRTFYDPGAESGLESYDKSNILLRLKVRAVWFWKKEGAHGWCTSGGKNCETEGIDRLSSENLRWLLRNKSWIFHKRSQDFLMQMWIKKRVYLQHPASRGQCTESHWEYKYIHSHLNFNKGWIKELRTKIKDIICVYECEPLTVAREAGMLWFTVQFSTATVSVSIKPPILTRCNNFFCFITNFGGLPFDESAARSCYMSQW